MNTKTLSLLAVATLALGCHSFAASVNDYQITGPVLEVTDNMIAVQVDKKDRWEIKKDASTKGAADIKVGDKVTIHYTMTAAKIENKGAAAAPKDEKKK